MDYDIIKSRHSVRSYTLQPLSADEVAMLDSQIRRYNAEGSLNMQLVVNEPNAFGRSLMAHYGKFRNVTNYIALTGPKSNDTEAKLGYYGEKIVLEAQKAGLNTCWVGLSFSKKNTSIDIPDGNKLYIIRKSKNPPKPIRKVQNPLKIGQNHNSKGLLNCKSRNIIKQKSVGNNINPTLFCFNHATL
ncbi:nitroreductase family protein [uncultured Muribaculum sp.]|uniref:nitroreductase family protein n=1 Tax=uncultured Muribaculum sp. TaxID=1918613 RepID=UPI002729B68A|nr:nitroreductase family protein [uncultured Muribaculum sp.]